MIEKRKSQVRQGIVAGVLVFAGIVYLLLPLITFQWTQRPYIGVMLDPNLVVNDAGEDSWPARQGADGLLYPDRIVAVNDTAVSTLADLQQVITGKRVGDEITLTIVQPPAELGLRTYDVEPMRAKTIPLIQLTFADVWEQFWFFYVVGLLMLPIGIWAFWSRPRMEAAQIYALLMAFTALGVGLLFDTRTTQYLLRLWILSLSLTCGLSVWLALIYPHENRLVVRFKYARWLVLIPGLLVGIWAQLTLFDVTAPWDYVYAWQALFFLNGLGLIISVALIGYRAYRSPSPTVRQQARIMFWAGVVGYTPIILFFAGLASGASVIWLPQVLVITLLILYPLAIGYTIVRYRLEDTDKIMRRGLTYGVMLLVVVGAFTVVVLGITAVLGDVLDFNNPLLLAALIVIIVLVFDPLRNRLQTTVDQMFFSQPIALDNLLRDYNRELTTAVNVDQVASMLMLYVRTGIPHTAPQLYLPDQEGLCYNGYYEKSDLSISADSGLVQYMKRVTRAIDLTELRTWPEALKAEKAAINAMNTAVLVPMNDEREILGWLVMPPKKNNEPYHQSELTYLTALADQTLIGLERANMVQHLENRIQEQDKLAQFSQALNFTIDFDDMQELVSINYERMFDLQDFRIYLHNHETNKVYTAFHLERGERYESREGPDKIVEDPYILQVIQTGQMLIRTTASGHEWIAAPLNAGADTLGVLHGFYRDQQHTLSPRQQQLFMILADQTATALSRLESNRQLRERAMQLEIINEVNFSLASTIELEPLLELILDKAIELLDTEAGTFMVTDLDTGELEFRVVRGPASEGLIGTRLPVGTGLAGTAAQTGRAILVNKAKDDKRWFSNVDRTTEFHTNSILTVPLLRHNTVWGVVQLINKQSGGPFTEEDQNLLTAFASQAVVAMENARLLAQTDEALQKSVNELSLLQQLDRDLNTKLDLTHILNLALDRTLSICDGTSGAIVLMDEDNKPYRVVTRGYEPAFDVSRIAGDDGLVGQVIQSQKPYVSNNVHEEPNYVTASFSTHSQMTMPLFSKQQLIGVMTIESDRLHAFEEDDVATAVRVTDHASVAIANAILYEQVNEANNAKSEFVSMVSHELKTPMTSMRGFTDLLLSGMTGELTEQQRGFLETISVNIRRMGQLIQDLTDISRIETGRFYINLAPTSFVHVMNETLQIVRGPCEEKGIALHLHMPEDLPLVMADKERLVQVLTNLLSNAAKYSPAQTEVHVAFEARQMPNGQDGATVPMVHVSVQDQGYGISEEDQHKLFTKFFRSEDPNIRQSKGTGLGLSITKGILELHHGDIWVESELGKGTTFMFAVPQVAALEMS